MNATTLFQPLTLRSVTVPNRIAVSPMCQYSATGGFPGDWHLVHLGSRAIGGAGLVFTEATAVTAQGRISPQDTGIWSDEQAKAWQPIAAFLREHGAVAGIQLAHAGFKGSTHRPWDGHGAVPDEAGGWTPVAPTGESFVDSYRVPRPLDETGIEDVVAAFASAAKRAVAAGFQVVEVHAAHGYLLHEFLSPLTNTRTDGYGGDLAGRARLAVEVTTAVRDAVGVDVPVFVRVSATDWTDGGLTVDDVAEVAGWLRDAGADLIDVSSGGVVAHAEIPLRPGYQVPLAETVRRKAGVPTGAVGLITDARQAEDVLAAGSADLVFMARELLRDPYWPRHAASQLGVEIPVPAQYQRAFQTRD